MCNNNYGNDRQTLLEWVSEVYEKIKEVITRINNLTVDVLNVRQLPEGGKNGQVATPSPSGGYEWIDQTGGGGSGDVTKDGNNVFTGENEFVLPLKVADGTTPEEAVNGRQLDELADEVNAIAGDLRTTMGNVTTNTANIKDNKDRIVANHLDTAALQGRLDVAEPKISANTNSITSINEDLTAINEKLNSVESAAGQNAQNIQTIEEKLTVPDTAKAGDVLTLGDTKTPEWKAPSGGGGTGEYDGFTASAGTSFLLYGNKNKPSGAAEQIVIKNRKEVREVSSGKSTFYLTKVYGVLQPSRQWMITDGNKKYFGCTAAIDYEFAKANWAPPMPTNSVVAAVRKKGSSTYEYTKIPGTIELLRNGLQPTIAKSSVRVLFDVTNVDYDNTNDTIAIFMTETVVSNN